MLSRFVSCFVTENAVFDAVDFNPSGHTWLIVLCSVAENTAVWPSVPHLGQGNDQASLLQQPGQVCAACQPGGHSAVTATHLEVPKRNHHPPAISADVKLVSVSLLPAMSNCLVDCSMARKKKHLLVSWVLICTVQLFPADVDFIFRWITVVSDQMVVNVRPTR